MEIFGEDVTAEGETLHTMADHSAHYTEDGDTFAEWWQAVAEISDQERAPRTESVELSEVAESEAVVDFVAVNIPARVCTYQTAEAPRNEHADSPHG